MNNDDKGKVYSELRVSIYVVAALTLLLVVFVFSIAYRNLSSVITFLAFAGASFVIGSAMGFLFGLPRAEKFRFIKKEDFDHHSFGTSYSDNTNLEEVSDWLTKIIVGLSLVKFELILAWINNAALRIDSALRLSSDSAGKYYVFGYSIIILYFLLGGGILYLWARTRLGIILTHVRKSQSEIEKEKTLLRIAQKNANASLRIENERLEQIPGNGVLMARAKVYYNSKRIVDKTDIQSKRWGGSNEQNDYILEANYQGIDLKTNFVRILLTIRSLDVTRPLAGIVPFFLHNTFPEEVAFAESTNNMAKITITAYEAFVVGTRLEDGTELELNLNKVKGFPKGFYWEE